MEPPWIKHDRSRVCPVPAGHDVEVRYEPHRWHKASWTWRGDDPERNPYWNVITHYRDWTAWEQSKMTKADDVLKVTQIEDLPGMMHQLQADVAACLDHFQKVITRHIAAHEPAPVDPLLAEAREICACMPGVNALQAGEYRSGRWDAGGMVDLALAALRRGREIGLAERPQFPIKTKETQQ